MFTLAMHLATEETSGGQQKQQFNYPPRKLTCHWKIPIFNRKYIFKWWIFHCHVSFRRGITRMIWPLAPQKIASDIDTGSLCIGALNLRSQRCAGTPPLWVRKIVPPKSRNFLRWGKIRTKSSLVGGFNRMERYCSSQIRSFSQVRTK